MSNQDFPFGHNYLGPFAGPDFSDNEFYNDIPNVEPFNSLLFQNVFGHTGRSVIHSAIQGHPGLGRGRMPILTPYLARPLIDMREELQINPPFFDQQQPHQFQAHLANHIGRIRAQVPAPPARAAPPQPNPQPAVSGRNRKRRASEKAISELKHMRLIDLKEDDDCCIICMEAFVDIKSSTDEPKRENALQMPCGHVFGSHCLKLWLKDHSTCPTCRKEVDFIEDDERGGRGVVEMNRRRNAIDREMTNMRRTAERMARRQGHMQQHARDEAMMQHQVLEVELIVQRQRFAPRMDPAAREHGAEDAGWMAAGPHAPLQQLPSHYSQYLGIGIFPESRGHVVEEPINSHHDPSAGIPRAPPVQQALPRPGMLLNYNHHPGVVNRAGAPQEMFGPGGVPAFPHRHHQQSTMPQRSQSQRQSQRQSQYFQPYPEVNMTGRVPASPNTGSVGQGVYTPDLGNAVNDPTAFPLLEYTPPNLSNMHGTPQGTPSNRQNQHQNQSHYLYGWESNRRLQQQHQQHQQAQQAFADPSPLPSQAPANQLPGTSRPTCADRQQPTAASPPKDQCELAGMSMCQHTFHSNNFSAGSTTILPPSVTQIVNLGCGHGFHRACLMSAMKTRAPRTVTPGRWLCAKCGRYEFERSAVEGRRQSIGHPQQTVG